MENKQSGNTNTIHYHLLRRLGEPSSFYFDLSTLKNLYAPRVSVRSGTAECKTQIEKIHENFTRQTENIRNKVIKIFFNKLHSEVSKTCDNMIGKLKEIEERLEETKSELEDQTELETKLLMAGYTKKNILENSGKCVCCWRNERKFIYTHTMGIWFVVMTVMKKLVASVL